MPTKPGICALCGRSLARPPALPAREKIGLKVKIYLDQVYQLQRVYDSVDCLALDLTKLREIIETVMRH